MLGFEVIRCVWRRAAPAEAFHLRRVEVKTGEGPGVGDGKGRQES